jgi:thermitase
MSDNDSNNPWMNGFAVLAGTALVAITVVVLVGSGRLAVDEPLVESAAQLRAKALVGGAAFTEATSSAPVTDQPSAALVLVANEDPLMASIRKVLETAHAVPNEALLTFKTKADLAQFLRLAGGFGLKIIGTVDGLNAARVGFENASKLRDYLAAAKANAPSLEANQWMTVPRLPKEDAGNQSGSVPVGDNFLADINAVGDRTAWGKGIKVAVLDTGVKDHSTFGSGQVTHIDLVNDGKPLHSHGTSVASLIAGQDERVPGVAPGAEILDIRVADGKGYSVSSVLAQGIIEATNRGARIINISMGGYDDSALLRQAVAYAQQKGAFIVAAAGNESYDQLVYPAAIEQVVSVASVDGQNKQAYFSNSGKNLDFAAPGVGLSTAWETNMVATASGTSQSAGVVSGIMAANLSLGVRAPDLLRQMQRDARVTGAPPNQVGSGVARVTGRR